METPRASGYSGTPLAKKLGIRAGSSVMLSEAPEGYETLLEPLPAGVQFKSRPGKDVDIAHIFVTRREELTKHLDVLRKTLKPEAAVWVSWPKKASKVPTTVTEDTIREVAFPLGLTSRFVRSAKSGRLSSSSCAKSFGENAA